jgi:hypothetical protein
MCAIFDVFKIRVVRISRAHWLPPTNSIKATGITLSVAILALSDKLDVPLVDA